ncbi:uncharacterized homolog isoform X1 [Dendrobates tinctorius]|uniref:uncharacterized homolog isoform X1 n=1 Tax=Dendrobates tinctorius TaxID=92724 RepID=UPI003CCA40B3
MAVSCSFSLLLLLILLCAALAQVSKSSSTTETTKSTPQSTTTKTTIDTVTSTAIHSSVSTKTSAAPHSTTESTTKTTFNTTTSTDDTHAPEKTASTTNYTTMYTNRTETSNGIHGSKDLSENPGLIAVLCIFISILCIALVVTAVRFFQKPSPQFEKLDEVPMRGRSHHSTLHLGNQISRRWVTAWDNTAYLNFIQNGMTEDAPFARYPPK